MNPLTDGEGQHSTLPQIRNQGGFLPPIKTVPMRSPVVSISPDEY